MVQVASSRLGSREQHNDVYVAVVEPTRGVRCVESDLRWSAIKPIPPGQHRVADDCRRNEGVRGNGQPLATRRGKASVPPSPRGLTEVRDESVSRSWCHEPFLQRDFDVERVCTSRVVEIRLEVSTPRYPNSTDIVAAGRVWVVNHHVDPGSRQCRQHLKGDGKDEP